MSYILPLLLSLLASVATAQPSKSIEQLRKEEELRRAMATLDDASAKINAMLRTREVDCEMAVGYKPFCSCIMRELPVAWSFSDYIAITTKSKAENGYPKMNAELRAAYDKVGPIRDSCVRAINAKP